MKFVSTKNKIEVEAEEAIFSGTASDGGLFMPSVIPKIEPSAYNNTENFQLFSNKMLGVFFNETVLEDDLHEIVSEALNFEVIQRDLSKDQMPISLLELFHGPTAAFKDFGARFLAASMSKIIKKQANPKAVTILVATSGDTGSAVASAFHNRQGFNVVVLFPNGRVSPRQQQQLTCWGNNVVSVAINGEFDDCQRLVKEAFAQEGKFKNQTLCSANSINIGRLLPQATYYAWSSQRYFLKHGMQTSFIIPTGNLGNAFACFIAKEMGFPIEKIVFATNANRTIPDFLETGFWQPRPTTPTLASAMDVGNPSNMERFFHVFDDRKTLLDTLRAVSVTDEQITNQISSEYLDNQILCCPHTATALHVYREFSNKEKKETHWCIVATAHPSKFEQTVEPIIGEEIAVPERLRALLELDSSFVTIDPELNQLIEAIASA